MSRVASVEAPANRRSPFAAAEVPLWCEGGDAGAEVELREGESAVFVLGAVEGAPDAERLHAYAAARFKETENHWRQWIGASTYRQQAIGVNLDTLQIDDRPDAPHIEPGHICQAVRQLAGLQDSELAAAFPIENQPIPLFT